MTRSSAAVKTALEIDRFMRHDHEEIERDLVAVIASAEANDPTSLLETWNVFERHLVSHLEAEEQFLFPRFATFMREEAFALLSEHASIRRSVLEIGIAIELHDVRCEQLRTFAALLEVHSRREDALVYRWAGERLDPTRAAQIRARVEW